MPVKTFFLRKGSNAKTGFILQPGDPVAYAVLTIAWVNGPLYGCNSCAEGAGSVGYKCHFT
jgi:hypothetical protein